MRKTANFSLSIFTVLFCFGLTVYVQAQDYATVVSFKETKPTNVAKKETFIPASMASASFAGGMEAWSQYLAENLVYPFKARENAVEGKVVVGFWVSPTGKAEGIEIMQSLGYGCDEEVKRLIEQSPRWNPAKQGERPVKSHVVLAVRFALEK